TVQVHRDDTNPEVEALREATIPPGQTILTPAALPGTMPGADVEAVVRWLRGTMDVFQNASNPIEFHEKAAQAVVENVGMDSGRVLMIEQGRWATKAVRTAPGVVVDPAWRPSQHVLNKVVGEKRASWQAPHHAGAGEDAVSLIGLGSVVAAPILDRKGEVLGVVYGERR